MKNPDVRREDINPLFHFIKYGWKEKRNPSQNFNISYYLEKNPDVAEANINPLIHYIKHGQKENRLIRMPNKIVSNENIKKRNSKKLLFDEKIFSSIDKHKLSEKVDIIVCVGPNPENFYRCYESIKSHTNPNDYILNIVIHEQDYLKIQDLVSASNITVYQHNMTYFNFSKANNMVIKDTENDVLLLNDDTEVTEDWLNKIRRDSKGVALTGAHTCKQCTGNSEMWGKGPAQLTYKPINMFCCFIPKIIIKVVGLLDEEFSYYGGDDNDYSMRVLKNGFPLIISEAYVKHKHHQSYGEMRNVLIIHCRKILYEKHRELSPFELENIYPLISMIIVLQAQETLTQHQTNLILDQNYDNIELIIVHKELSQRSKNFINKAQKLCANTITINLPKNTNAANARNLGLTASKGQFIIFVNNKVNLKYQLEEYLRLVILNPSISALFINYKFSQKAELDKIFGLDITEIPNLIMKFESNSSCIFGRRHLFFDVPFYSYPGIAMEFDWLMRAHRKKHMISVCNNKEDFTLSNKINTLNTNDNLVKTITGIMKRERDVNILRRSKDS